MTEFLEEVARVLTILVDYQVIRAELVTRDVTVLMTIRQSSPRAFRARPLA